jgi:hypothetical protein
MLVFLGYDSWIILLKKQPVKLAYFRRVIALAKNILLAILILNY